MGIISVLCSQGPLLKKELAEAIDKDQTTVVRMIQSMEKRDCKKDLNEQDRRSHNLFLTEKGDELKENNLACSDRRSPFRYE